MAGSTKRIFILLLCLFFVSCTKKTNIQIIVTDAWNGKILAESSPENPQIKKGGAVLAVAMYEKLRTEAKSKGYTPILVNVGSSLFGSREAWFTRGTSPVDFMNLAKFDLMAVGNRDYDLGPAALGELAKRANFPFLSSNIFSTQSKSLINYARPYKIITVDKNVKVGIAALWTQTVESALAKNSFAGLTIGDPFVAFKWLMTSSEFGKADIKIIVLNYVDESNDFMKRFAKEIAPNINLLVEKNKRSKQTDQILETKGVPELMIEQHWFNVGTYSFSYDKKTKQLSDASWKKIDINSNTVEPGQMASQKLEEIQRNLSEILSKKYGILISPLEHRFNGESLLGDFVCDIAKSSANADFAMFNAGGVRGRLDTSVTVGSLATAIPFDNFLVRVGLTGSKIIELINHNLTNNLEEIGLLQFSTGIKIYYFLDKNKNNKVKKIEINNKPLKLDKTYQVVTNDFLAGGGDGFTMFSKVKDQVLLNVRIRDVVAKYITAKSPINYKPESRHINFVAKQGK